MLSSLMPRRELSRPHQIHDWLVDWGKRIEKPAEMILIGSGGILWHAHERGVDTPLPENSMDVDPVTDSEEVARLCYDSIIGSEFEAEHGWHVNLMPHFVLNEFPEGWMQRSLSKSYGNLTVVVPALHDLLIPKLRRGEERDEQHATYADSLDGKGETHA